MVQKSEIEQIAAYVSSLERERSRLLHDVAQLRSSHSFRLGQAFVLYQRNRRFLAVGKLIAEIRAAMRPQSVSVAVPKARYFKMLKSGRQAAAPTGAMASEASTSIRSQILRKAASGHVVVAIAAAPLAQDLASFVDCLTPRFDGYDTDWDALRPGSLILQPEGLRDLVGWTHALSLLDATATMQLVQMLKAARSRSMRTILVEPAEAWRFPLLSRIIALFDERIPVGDDLGGRLATRLGNRR